MHPCSRLKELMQQKNSYADIRVHAFSVFARLILVGAPLATARPVFA